MSKLSKRAILTYVIIAIFLTVMIPIMPAQADMGPVSVSGASTVDSFYILFKEGIATWTWETEPDYVLSGLNSVKLFLPNGADTDDAAAVIIPYNAPLADLPTKDADTPGTYEVVDDTDFYFKCYSEAAVLPAWPYIILSIDTDSDGERDYVLVSSESRLPDEGYAPTGELDTWQKLSPGDDDDGEPGSTVLNDGWACIDVGGGGTPIGGYNPLGYWQNEDVTEGGTVINIKIWYGSIAARTQDETAYVDDVTINGVLYPLEEKGTQEGKELTVSGTGVTSGTPVNIYWDYVTAASVMDTITAGADGTYECDVDVPSDVFGYHYIWTKDTSTGQNLRWKYPVFVLPSISFSPSSGLEDDDITITGYGFSAEAEVTITFPKHTTDQKLSADTGTVTTDELGCFEYTFEITATEQDEYYPVTAIDENGVSVTDDFTVGASITVTPDSGPSGSKIEVSGEGFEDSATLITYVKIIGDGDPKDCFVIDEGDFEVDGGEFTIEIVIPSVDDIDDYEKIEVDIGTKTVSTKFEVTGTTVITVDPAFGVQGSTVIIHGYNFTAISEEEVTLKIGETLVETFETDSDGEFSGTFIVPAIKSDLYTLTASQEEKYGITTSETFNVGIMIVILNPNYGPTGTKVYLTGTGFTEGKKWNATFEDIDILPTDKTEPVAVGTVSDEFFVPTIDVGTYTVTVTDIDRDINVKVSFNVIATTEVEFDPAAAPNDYNVTIEGSYFTAEAGVDLEFVLYNETEDWDPIEMTVWQGLKTPDPPEGDNAAVTDEDGNFTAWWIVPDAETLSIGCYTVNVTDENGLFAQTTFCVAEERVDVEPRKESFAIGDTVSFDVNNDFIYDGAYLKIWDPADNLYWRTDPILKADWTKVEDLYTVPYYLQTSGKNPMMLSPDAPLDTWTWAFYTSEDDQLVNGTFNVGRSSADVLTEKIDALSEELGMDIDTLQGYIDDLGIDMDEAVSSMAAEIATAVAAAEATANAVSDISETAQDALDAANNAVSAADAAKAAADAGMAAANDAKTTAQAAADAADKAAESAEAGQKATSGLTGLVYGAIGASLIAALAAIVSLMQISRRIAG